MVRHAWENMLRDEGLQYNFLSYVDVVQHGVPDQYRLLILPACLCLSDSEARAIRAFCERGGTVIADYLPGLWDQHGHGRAEGGVLDGMFGVKHDPAMHSADVFGGKLWVEVDQDANYSWKTYEDFLTNRNTCVKDASGFNKAVRAMAVDHVQTVGRGRAVLMNLSPQWYNAYRVAGFDAAKKRAVFLRHVAEAGVTPWVRIADAGDREHGYEITYWNLPPSTAGKPGRVLVFVCLNPETRGTATGGGNSVGLKTAAVPIKLHFAQEIRNARDEHSGAALGNGREFAVSWKQNEAVVVSMEGK
jgi:hypothetical protein